MSSPDQSLSQANQVLNFNEQVTGIEAADSIARRFRWTEDDVYEELPELQSSNNVVLLDRCAGGRSNATVFAIQVDGRIIAIGIQHERHTPLEINRSTYTVNHYTHRHDDNLPF